MIKADQYFINNLKEILNNGEFDKNPNMHIYDRYIETAKELLNKKTSDNAPIFNFEPKTENFYEFTINDFSMENYNPVKPQIKLEITI